MNRVGQVWTSRASTILILDTEQLIVNVVNDQLSFIIHTVICLECSTEMNVDIGDTTTWTEKQLLEREQFGTLKRVG
jgi:hypothetical protein